VAIYPALIGIDGSKKMTSMIVSAKTRESIESPSKADMELARVAQRCFIEALDRSKAVKIKLESETDDLPPIELPPASLHLIGKLLGLMSEGRPFTLIPKKQEMSTTEAAAFLNVSRPFVVKEVDAGNIPHRMVGTHRRIELKDLIEYADAMRSRRETALDELSQLSEELGGY
jgi:excisionase family DNA binding protein